MRNLLCLVFAIILLAALTAGCSSDAKKPTEDSIIAMEALDIVEELRKAYTSRDFSSMARFSTNDAYRSIAASLKSFDKVELSFTPKWMEIDRAGSAVEMLVAWKGTWRVGDKSEEKDGTVLFIIGGKPLKLQSIERLSPFSQP